MDLEYADYLYSISYEKEVEENYNYLIERELAEEKVKEEKYNTHIQNNYIRVGGN